MSIKKLVNPNAHKNNTIRLAESDMPCCDKGFSICKYKIDGTAMTNVTAVELEVDGTNQTFTFDAAANTPVELRKAIAEVVSELGYYAYAKDDFIGINITTDSAAFISEIKFVSLTIDGTVTPFVESCELGAICTYSGFANYDTDLGLLSIDGSTGTQIGTAAGFAAGDEAGLKSALIAAFTAEGNTAQSVTVSENPTYDGFSYMVSVPCDLAVTVGGAQLTHCDTTRGFIF